MTSQRIYIIGAGVIGRKHADAVESLPNADDIELFVADLDSAAREAFREDHRDASMFEQPSQMLSDDPRDDDVVVVATPPFTHHDLATMAIERGRNVLCDKPIATTVEEAEEMIALADERDVLFASCSCRFLGYPPTDRVAELVDTGALGDVYHVTWVSRQHRSRSGIEYQPESRWFLDSDMSGGGILMNWGEYDLAVLNDVFSTAAVEVRDAWKAQPTAAADLPEDVTYDVEHHVGAALSLRTGDGSSVPVTYERAECTHGEERSTSEIEGTDGALRWVWHPWADDETVTRSFDDNGTVQTETESFETGDGLGAHDRPLVYFTRELAGESTPIRAGRDALFDFRCLRAIYESAESGDSVSVERDARND